MSSLSIDAVIEKNRLHSKKAWVIALKIYIIDPYTGQPDGFLRLVSNDEQVTIAGEVYQPMPFEVDTTEAAGEIPTIAVKIQDQSRTIQAAMQQYRGGINFPVDVMVAYGDTSTLEYEPDLTQRLYVVSSSSQSYLVTWNLGASNPLRAIFPASRQMRNRCRWGYKSIECGYSGPMSTCSRTLNGPDGCEAHGNTRRFGGYPGIVVRG